MDITLKIFGRLGLVLTLLPCFLYLFDFMTLSTTKLAMLVGTVMWLVTAPIIQKRNQQAALSGS